MPQPMSVLKNIKTVSEIEAQALSRRTITIAARIGDTIATEAGRMWFILLHVVWFAVWFGLNLRGNSQFAFDPFPFSLLTMIVSLESIFLSLFILMSQNRSTIQADQRNHLDLQINLLSEDEHTKMIEMLQALCLHHKLAIADDPEIAAFGKRTDVREVLTVLENSIPTKQEEAS